MKCFSVKAFDSTCPEKGAVFEVPITVAKPEMVQREIGYSKQYFAPGDIQRRFISVPKDATWAGECIFLILIWLIINILFHFIVLSISLENQDVEANNARFIIHGVQLIPELACRSGVEFYKLVDLIEHGSNPLTFAVQVTFKITIFSTTLKFNGFIFKREDAFWSCVWRNGGLVWELFKSTIISLSEVSVAAIVIRCPCTLAKESWGWSWLLTWLTKTLLLLSHWNIKCSHTGNDLFLHFLIHLFIGTFFFV